MKVYVTEKMNYVCFLTVIWSFHIKQQHVIGRFFSKDKIMRLYS